MVTKESIIEELHKPARRLFPRRSIVLKGIHDLHQADLIEMIPYSKENKGFRYILTIINCFTKVADAIPLKNKSANETAAAMKKYLSKHKVKNLQTDFGKEFYNLVFKKLMQDYKINHYSTYSEIKGAIIERFNRTLKGEMYKRLSLRGSYKWYDILPDLLHNYNNRFHRTIGMKPLQVNKKNESIVKERIKRQTYPNQEKRNPRRFYIGDNVRISKQRSLFSKKYLPNWTNETFIVHRIQPTFPETYILKDKSGKILNGSFYGHELMKTKTGDVYLIEKILKQKDNKLLVRWFGFSESDNSWINKSDVL